MINGVLGRAVSAAFRRRGAGPPHRRVKRDRVGIVLATTPLQHRREIGAAAEPRPAGDDEPRVHVHGRNVRVRRMGDERDARSPETWVDFGARDLFAKFLGERAEHRRDMHADLFE